MRIFKYTRILLLIVGLIISHACTNLDEKVFSEVTADNFFQTEDQVIAGIGSAYTNLYGYTNNNHMWTLNEASSDELVVPTKGSDWFGGGRWQRLHRHEWTTEAVVLDRTWILLYGGINATNRLIYQLEEEIGTEEALAFIPELRAFRAFYYYHLVDLFGNVPIVTDFIGASETPPTQSRQEVFNFVESELLSSLDGLSTDVSASYGRINYYAAQAILTKLYANAEEYTGTARWEDALNAAREITNSGEYNLSADYFSNFDEDNSGSPEFIFSIPYDEVFAPGFVIGSATLHYGNQDTYDLAYQPWNGWTAVGDFYDTYEDTDIRKGIYGDHTIRGNFLTGPQVKSNGEPVIDNAWEQPNPDDPEAIVDPDGPQVVLTPHPNSTTGLFWLRQDGARIAKFEYARGSQRNMNNDFPIFRYTDIVMLEAEMLWRLGQDLDDALTLMNMIRERAGVTPFASLTADNILAERGRELFAEGHRRPDLIRFGKFNDAWFEKPASDPTRKLYPIPAAQLEINSNLVQNPGY